MAKHEFLSDGWFAAVAKIQEDNADEAAANLGSTKLAMNQVVTGAPDGATIEFHISIADGKVDFSQGHLEVADVTLTTDFDTAKTLLVGADPQAGMQAFMQGKIKVAGDISKLMAMGQGGGALGGAGAAAVAIREITAD